ncbi:hypothetical protein MRX96_027399 [Rhipicephalus microplus]
MDCFDPDVIPHLVDCTAAENQTCHIADKISLITDLLLGSKMVLREHPHTLDQLHLDNSGCTATIHSFNLMRRPHYPELLAWLLRTHRCILSSSLELSLVNESGLTTLDAMHRSSRIRRLKLCFFGIGALNSASQTLPSLRNVELECTSILTSAFLFQKAFIDAISHLLQNSSSLNTLRLHTFSMRAHVADSFFAALSCKSRLKELNLQKCSLDCSTYPYALMGYLATTTLLKVLVVDMTNELLQSAVLEGVSMNTSIETLTIGKYIVHDRSAAAVAGVLKNNQVLRKLSISTKDCSEPGVHTVYGCWLLPLIENETLEEVSLPLLILHPLQWAAFFKALRTKEKLKNVHIEVPGDHRELLSLVCAELKSSGSDGKISMGCLQSTHDHDLLQCKAFSGVQFPRAEHIAMTALSMVPNCPHLTIVIMNIKRDDVTLFCGLAQLLRNGRSLRRLQLCVWPGDQEQDYFESGTID